jgi:A/G-specific adenine glycosylase
MEEQRITLFRKRIYAYYREHRRSFPWRETFDPYKILVSELMLQQTQTERVLKKYQPFIDAFPDFASLDKAPLRDVLSHWQGLGYNRRGKALKDIARMVLDRGGELPKNPEALKEFPFVGQSTAGAVCAFAFGYPSVFIETNIRRVFIHSFFDPAVIVTDREILPLVALALDRGDPRNWYYALMDYGVFLKGLEENPNQRSAHYSVQSAFKDSNREVRGKIVKLLVGHSPLSVDRIIDAVGVNPERIYTSLEGLVAEGIVTEKEGLFRI